MDTAATQSAPLFSPDELFAEDEIDFDVPCLVNKNSICPFTVVVDSNEQAPYHFLSIEPFRIVPLSHRKLKTGDYSIESASREFDPLVTIERKSISDFLGSITGGRERFEREFKRMAEMRFAAVVVEGEFSQVLTHARERTMVDLESIFGTVTSWMIRYRVHFWFCLSRRHAEMTTLRLLCQFWKEHKKK